MLQNRALSLTRVSFIGCFFCANKAFPLPQERCFGDIIGPHTKATGKKSEKKIEVEKSRKSMQNHTLRHAIVLPKKDPNQGDNRFPMHLASANPGCSNSHIWWKLDFSALTRAQAYENISKTQGITVLNENAWKPRAFLDKGFLYKVVFGANKAFPPPLERCLGDIIGPHTKAQRKKSEKKNEVEKSGKSMQNHTLHMQKPCPRRTQTKDTTDFQWISHLQTLAAQTTTSDENLIFRLWQGPKPMKIYPKHKESLF